MFQDKIKERQAIILGGFKENDLEKSRSGRYTDTSENRSKNRVGEQYGSKKEEDPKKEKTTKGEDPKKDTSKKGEDPKKNKESKTVDDHAKDTETEELQSFVDNADEKTDPDLLAKAESELKARSKDGKSETEVAIMKIDEDIAYYKDEIQQSEELLKDMKSPALKSHIEEGIMDGNKEIRDLEGKKKKLETKSKKEKQSKIEKNPDDFIKVASVDDLSKKSSELSKEAIEAMKEGNYKKSSKLAEESSKYAKAASDKIKELIQEDKNSEKLDSTITDHIDGLNGTELNEQLIGLNSEIKRMKGSDNPDKENLLSKYNTEKDYIVDKLSTIDTTNEEAEQSLIKDGHKTPSDGMIKKRKNLLDFQNKTKLSSKDDAYVEANKEDIKKMVEDDIFLQVKDAIKEHKEKNNKSSEK